MGFMVLAAMDTKTRDVEAVLADFRQCLNTYDAWAESFWRFSALELEQVFKVGDEVALMAPISSKAPSSTVAMCKASGTLTLVHLFESTRFVPIGNTPVMLQAIPADGGPLGEPIYKTIGPSGILEVTECTRDQLYRITFYPNVSRDHVKALYASYQSILAPLESQLRKDWTDTFEPLWQEYREANFVQRYRLLDQGYANGFGHVLHELWDNIEHLYQWLADLRPNSEKLLQYLAQTELDALLELSQDAIANGLLVLSDEPLLFIYLAAMVSWMRMLPPPYLNELLGQITAEVLINLLLVWVTAGMGVTVRLGAQVLGKVKSGRVRQWLEQMARPFADTRLDRHAEALRPLLLGSPATPIKTVPSVPLKAGAMEVTNPVPLVREKSAPKTTLIKHQAVDDAPSSAKNPNGQASASADNTATHGCPVSMVTGEELLTLTDGELDGVLPFAWTRLYRTSAVEVDCGLGFGWSHSLAQRLCVVGGSVVWTDHENRSTTFPLPSTARPAISNSLAEAAIYLGAASDELVLAQGARFYHFHDGVLTAISDAYDNRLRISRDGLGRILRLDNGAGRALLLRYDRGHIVAVDYQVFRVDSEADD
ncbi:DUF6531 domain-containing protein, partial [Pseudomonas gessardii]